MGVGQLRVKGFKDATSNLWRVDIDFDRADFADCPDPVSRFTLQCREMGADRWQDVPDLRIMLGGKMYMSVDEARALGLTWADKHAGYIPGDYRFGNEMPSARNAVAGATDKGYTQTTPEDDAFPAVAYHVTTTSPAGNEYRVTANYAIANPHAAKTASSQATLSADDFTVTSVVDIAVLAPDATVRYYDLQGRPVASPQCGAIYIRVQGTQAQKVKIKIRD